MVLPASLKYINKRFTNRLMRLIAGKPGSPIGLIRHRGRKSGKLYDTPILPARLSDAFVFALTYGPGVDWYRNILADKKAELVLKGKTYALIEPLNLPADSGQQAFGGLTRFLLNWLGVQGFFQMAIDRRINSD